MFGNLIEPPGRRLNSSPGWPMIFYGIFILRALEANRLFMWSEATRYRCSYSVFGADKCGVAE